jgi:sulfoquinovosyltransferase
MSSNRNLRENQYTKGLARFFKLKSLRKAIKAIGLRRRAVALCDFFISGQHILQVAIFAVAVSALIYSRQVGSLAAVTKVKAAFGATSWLKVAESAMDKAGPVLAPLCLTAITTLAAMIPFVPTQPLFIMAGLFFGPAYGAALGLCAAVCAAVVSASASRARGYRQFSDDLAQQTRTGAPARRSIAAQLKKVNRAVRGDGDALAQASKVSLMRLLPHAPFTVTNYLLGLTQVPIRAIAAGTAFGMAPWVVFYAIVGADSRALFASGASLSSVVAAAAATGAARAASLFTSTELGLVALCAALLLLRPAAPASPFVAC